MPVSPAIASPQECRDFIAARPEIRFVEILFTSMTGVPRGKRLRIHELQAVFDHGRYLPGSVLVVDTCGQDCESTGLVWEDGDADRITRPVPGTLRPAPWLGADVAQVMVSMYELDGRPNDLDPRHVLARVLDRFHADGLTPVAACELEYYLVDLERGAMGELRPFAPRQIRDRASQVQVYGLPELEESGPFLADLWKTADVLGIPLEGAISECSPAQVELTLRHKDNALEAADDAVLYKRAAKGVALRHGCEATFMAKPWSDRAGSGFHVHVSFNNAAGENVCASEEKEGSSRLRFAIGGMKELMAPSLAILAPNANSYRRFKANSYAPTRPAWGVNNRTVSLRVPAGPPSGRHVEHRLAGADANPYLALAVILAGAHYGMTRSVDPGPPVTGNGYAAPDDPASRLPTSWGAAIDAFEASAVLKDYLGERFCRMYAEVKRTELARYEEVVSSLDYDWCLRNA